ncbi:LysE family transporter [Winogradskyella sp.]|jgi:threonine/homoserine/homoserine lactone efflux protein|uniref:LysE family transporter n=1 Tax=Winogradskyella sp. TaxID=1883156 RepID=UPI0025DC3846|nr:LysE family transporter [Winogradskyella sp.]MCT4628845.1 LysE family translocator [Winogradskyella sp.]
MILIYLIIGIIASVLGALPLGASNIAVINTTIKQNAVQAYKIAITAGIAELVLSYYALHCNMTVKDFFNANQWIQVLIAIILLGVGGFLFFRPTKVKPKNTKSTNRLLKSKYAIGFFLGLLNPPVLVYWLVVYGVINNNVVMLSLQSSLSVLFLFFIGVYIGKIFTLYIYSKFSLVIKQKFQNINTIINKVTGSLLFMIGLVNVLKFYFL